MYPTHIPLCTRLIPLMYNSRIFPNSLCVLGLGYVVDKVEPGIGVRCACFNIHLSGLVRVPHPDVAVHGHGLPVLVPDVSHEHPDQFGGVNGPLDIVGKINVKALVDFTMETDHGGNLLGHAPYLVDKLLARFLRDANGFQFGEGYDCHDGVGRWADCEVKWRGEWS